MKGFLPMILGGVLVLTAFAQHGGQGTGEEPQGHQVAQEAEAPEQAVEASPDLLKRIQALEAEVADLRAKQVEAKGQLEKTLTYLQRQAKSADAMLATLDASESEGFVAGINYHSREILLAGLRSYLDEVKKDVPATARPKKAEAEPQEAP
jgi:hypothetical protein